VLSNTEREQPDKQIATKFEKPSLTIISLKLDVLMFLMLFLYNFQKVSANDLVRSGNYEMFKILLVTNLRKNSKVPFGHRKEA
jgi:hypothetical protein